ncbi:MULTISPECIES: AAA family ATPase [unclassified Microcoleus]|uniref:AAA family ATPase n=1 Tax=unclassified Microcoleus TaxID=2642155 RepID=UPI001DFE19E1|nr:MULTISPECIES: AAA family ATPase [unclassified Microcoleus]TAE07415.1 MAG: HD domain-containing protein [Oscillatoriales cyanobacterium]MCC3414974.1 AAA family ATPase [Microcoleus sp. PH2017_02_FOX_O_A]MCC3424680.1 AAA family ATPase [Microcoleus sp. PH2017_01_SCD_O_A]TAE18490.1 MAG: HD domain-containing protein [Oscillatoriales cyanobacterium]TAG66132.1 MAG: HD domain-containing protein [Oscillatoriales cyanobacterium]
MTALLSHSATWTFPFCPEPPDWFLDWESIYNHFDWIQNLEGCQQDPIYHAEGDVLIHTKMVCEALISSPKWRQLSAPERSMLFAAALLHDVAKPAFTKIEENGRISSKGHARQGARMVRQILAQFDPPVQFIIRETVCAIVQFGSLPIWLLDKPNPQQSVIKASQVVRCDFLALLAEADVRGRECSDRQEILDKIQLFREFCQENNCLDSPRQFASDHSRFIYFRKDNGNPDYEAFDDTRCEVVLMSGLPGSGKDYWIKENLPNWPVISLDALRKEMNVPPDRTPGNVIVEAKNRAREYMKSGRSFVWNATNTTKQMRQQLINFFAGYQARIRIVYLEVPLQEVLRRNRSRTAAVPEAAIQRLANRLDIPDRTEAHQVEWIVDFLQKSF